MFSFLFLFQGEPGQEDFLACYAQLEGLCQAMMSELASDRRLHDSGIFPQDVCLPQITAAQYCKVPTCCCLVSSFVGNPRVNPIPPLVPPRSLIRSAIRGHCLLVSRFYLLL